MDVVGIGALNVDMLYRVERIARLGEEVPILSAVRAPGGSAANTIVGLSRLGVSTGFIGNAGSDIEGKYILKDLKREGVDIKGVSMLKGSTGLIIGFIDKRGERVLYAFPGVNDALELNKQRINYAKNAKFLHMSSFVGDRSYRAQKKLLKKLRSVKISFSPGMLYAKKGFEALEALIKRAEVIFLNRKEMLLMTGLEFKKGSKKLLDAGAKVIAVTLGDRGCYVASLEESHALNAFKTKVVDTTGAGDAFSAGFLYGVLLKKDLKTCGKIGSKLASLCVAKVGAREGLPHEADFIFF